VIKPYKKRLSEDIEDLSSKNGISSVDINNQSQAKVTHSGNSNVDVYTNVQIDVMPLAFAILYSLLSMKILSNEEFELAIRRLEEYSINQDFGTSHLAPEGTKDEDLKLETAFLKNKIMEIKKEIEELKKKK